MACLRALLALAAAALVAACGPKSADKGPLVLAASSVQEGLEAAAGDWARQGHARPVLIFAGTSALARQVVSGAPGDLFVSADEQWLDALETKDLIRPGTRADILTNRLVLVAKAGSAMTLEPMPGFALVAALGDGRLAMADPDSVPAGRYGRAALTSLGVWPAVQSRVTASENVRAALALVSRGEAPLGVVYATDALAEPGVRVVAVLPAASHPAITYPIAQLRSSRHDEAEAFRRFLLSDQARGIFRRFGFGVPSR